MLCAASAHALWLQSEDAAAENVSPLEPPKVAAPPPSADPSEATQEEPADKNGPALGLFRRAFLDHLSEHMPMYFVYGPRAPGVKFQISLKYRLFTLDHPNRSQGLAFGYTQRSLWDITARSSPFYDTSYMPELFWESLSLGHSVHGGGVHWLGYQAGLQHESNGSDGGTSRSMNIVYARPIVMFGALEGWHLVLAPQLLYYLPGLAENPNIARDRGYGEGRAVFGKVTSVMGVLIGRSGSHFDRGSLEANLSLPLRIPAIEFASYFLVQSFQGYGESLRAYDRSSWNVRAGIALVR